MGNTENEVMYYTNKKNLGKINQMNCDFKIETDQNIEFGKKGDYVFTSLGGQQSLIRKEDYKDYILVKRVDEVGTVTPNAKIESLREAYIRSLNEMESLQQEEDWSNMMIKQNK